MEKHDRSLDMCPCPIGPRTEDTEQEQHVRCGRDSCAGGQRTRTLAIVSAMGASVPTADREMCGCRSSQGLITLGWTVTSLAG